MGISADLFWGVDLRRGGFEDHLTFPAEVGELRDDSFERDK